MALSIDGNLHIGEAGAATLSTTLTTTNAADIIVICFEAENISSGVTPVVSTCTVGGSNATKRNSVAWTNPAGVGGAKNLTAIYWFFAAAALTAATVSVVFTAPIDNAAMVAFGVTGFTGTGYHTNPWDVSAATALGWSVTNVTASATQLASAANISTVSAADLILAFGGSGDNTAAQAFGTKLGTSTAAGTIGGVAAAQVNVGAFEVAGTDQAVAGVEFLVVSTIQTNIAANFAATATAEGWVIMPDALTVAGGATDVLFAQIVM